MSKSFLIVDSGATKADWVVVRDNKVIFDFSTVGINVTYHNRYEIEEVLEDVVRQMGEAEAKKVEKIFFFGAGCGNKANTEILFEVLNSNFKLAEIKIESDLLAACQALCGREKGWVAILGTGAASCLYDGEKIIKQTPSLGYLLGDEGSGTYLGKLFLTKYLQKALPQSIKEDFETKFELSHLKVLENLYQKPFPNRFISSFAPYISSHIENPFIYSLCQQNFERFFQVNLDYYSNYVQSELNILGSIAFNFREIIEKVAKQYEVKINNIEKSPISGLIKMYSHV